MTPSKSRYHSLHHTQFRTNYSLFMPLYDHIYGTMDKSSDGLYESSLEGKEETPHFVYLTHPTSLQSIYHQRLGFASLASRPYAYKRYMLLMWPFTYLSMILTRIYGSTFVLERNSLNHLKMQTWAIPRFSFHYQFSLELEETNGLIEKAILDAEERGVKVVTLGLLNQGDVLNKNGEVYIQKYPLLKTRIVDGSSLAVAVVLQSVPPNTRQILLRGGPYKMASALALALCKRDVQVMVVDKGDYHALESQLPMCVQNYLVWSSNYTAKIWIVGDGLTDEEQSRATRGTHIIPFSQFPPRRLRNDCVYYSTPAMMIPKSLVNMDSCENWLPRRVMSAWRIAGMLHALEGWDQHECGNTVLDGEKVWSSALRHGFLPLVPVGCNSVS
uniref:Protein WAX2 n=1 Tax=Anthurium amnicola TaxID=1678845 RepID=A0A1D1YK90_9ARAE